MITHAAYSAAYPLPTRSAPLCIEYGVEPPEGIGRVIKPSSIQDRIECTLTDADFLAELSPDEWRSASHVSAVLQTSPEVVRRKLTKRAIEKLTLRRMVDGRYEWRLK